MRGTHSYSKFFEVSCHLLVIFIPEKEKERKEIRNKKLEVRSKKKKIFRKKWKMKGSKEGRCEQDGTCLSCTGVRVQGSEGHQD